MGAAENIDAGWAELSEGEIFYLHCHGIERLQSERSDNLKLARAVRCADPKIFREAINRARYWHSAIHRAALAAAKTAGSQP